eukprot:gene12863-7286_t
MKVLIGYLMHISKIHHADEKGLGKTIQIVCWINELVKKYNNDGVFLVIAPLATLPNWKLEFERWTNLNTILYTGNKKSKTVIQQNELFNLNSEYKFNVIITNFELVSGDETLNSIDWASVIVDEAHKLKNRKSKTFKTIKQLKFKHIILLSGTPIQSSLEELWSLLNIIDPLVFNSYSNFEHINKLDTNEQINEMISCSSKLTYLDSLLKSLSEDTSNKVLLFSQMLNILDIFEDYSHFRGWKYQRLDGTRLMGIASKKLGLTKALLYERTDDFHLENEDLESFLKHGAYSMFLNDEELEESINDMIEQDPILSKEFLETAERIIIESQGLFNEDVWELISSLEKSKAFDYETIKKRRNLKPVRTKRKTLRLDYLTNDDVGTPESKRMKSYRNDEDEHDEDDEEFESDEEKVKESKPKMEKMEEEKFDLFSDDEKGEDKFEANQEGLKYPFSKITCIKPDYNTLEYQERPRPFFQKTCKIKNLYVFNGAFHVFLKKSNPLESDLFANLSPLADIGDYWKPEIKRFDNTKEVEQFIQSQNGTFQSDDSVYLHYMRAVGFQMIHTMVDDTFSMYHILHKHGEKKIIEGTDRFTAIVNDVAVHRGLAGYPYGKVPPKMKDCFVGLKANITFPADYKHKNLILGNFIYGMFGYDAHLFSSEYKIPGYNDRIMYKFRNYFVKNLQEAYPQKFANRIKKKPGQKVVSILPKTTGESAFVSQALIIDQIKKAYPHFIVRVINFGAMASVADEVAFHLDTDISIGVEGSNTLLTLFQEPKTTYISLGRSFIFGHPGGAKFGVLGHQADFFYASMDYIRTLYYETYNNVTLLKQQLQIDNPGQFMNLFKEATTPFTIPRTIDQNLSQGSRACKQVMKLFPATKADFFGLLAHQKYNRYCAFLMCFVVGESAKYKIKIPDELRRQFYCR